METKATILEQLQAYKDKFEEEELEVDKIVDFVNTHSDTGIYDRKNFTGHLTASAFIVNESKDALLMLKHKFLNRWLQPGGHIDETDATILNAALREAKEETGLVQDQLIILTKSLFDINSHAIPENSKKQEPTHIHHDIRFLLSTNATNISISTEEATASKWLPIKELENDPEFGSVVRKIIRSNY